MNLSICMTIWHTAAYSNLEFDDIWLFYQRYLKLTFKTVILKNIIIFDTLNCITQPLSGIMSWVTAYTSLPSAFPQTITPSGELQKRCTEQSSENNQWSLTENNERKKEEHQRRIRTFFLINKLDVPSSYSVIPMGVSSCSLSGPILPDVPSAGDLSWLGSATPPNVSEICARGSEPAIRTLSKAQSLWSAPSCCGCHQRTRTPSWRAGGGSSTFTNLNTSKNEQGHRYPASPFPQRCAGSPCVVKQQKFTQAWCIDHRISLSAGASWFLHSNCTPEARPGYDC